jgi:hypothetical protein
MQHPPPPTGQRIGKYVRPPRDQAEAEELGLTLEYDSEGRVRRIVDKANGNILRVYDEHGNIDRGPIGAYLFDRMERLNLNQTDAARLTQISNSAMAKYVSGVKKPGPGAINKIAIGFAAREGRPNDQKRIDEIRNRLLRLGEYVPETVIVSTVGTVPKALVDNPQLAAFLDDLATCTPEEIDAVLATAEDLVVRLKRLRGEGPVGFGGASAKGVGVPDREPVSRRASDTASPAPPPGAAQTQEPELLAHS